MGQRIKNVFGLVVAVLVVFSLLVIFLAKDSTVNFSEIAFMVSALWMNFKGNAE